MRAPKSNARAQYLSVLILFSTLLCRNLAVILRLCLLIIGDRLQLTEKAPKIHAKRQEARFVRPGRLCRNGNGTYISTVNCMGVQVPLRQSSARHMYIDLDLATPSRRLKDEGEVSMIKDMRE